MIIRHYDGSHIECDEEEYNYLILTTQVLFEELDQYISELEILAVLFNNDDIYYSSYYLFKSKKPFDYKFIKYCNLAKLIYLDCIKNAKEIDADEVIYYLCSFG